MQILFAISAFCFAGVLWAVFAIARQVRANRLRNSPDAPLQQDFRHHILFAPETAMTFEAGVRQARQDSLRQSVKDITVNKQWILPPRAVRTRRASLLPFRVSEPRSYRAPQPARYGPMELLDRAYFSNDMGDLTDPYQPPPSRANNRSRPRPSARF